MYILYISYIQSETSNFATCEMISVVQGIFR